MARLEGFARRGFYHDGFWRQAEIAGPPAAGRVCSTAGWAARWPSKRRLAAAVAPALPCRPGGRPRHVRLALDGGDAHARRWLARPARPSAHEPRTRTFSRRHGPVLPLLHADRRPVLLGGAGLARLALGDGRGALDVEVRGPDSYSGPHFQRLALRLSLAGEPVLDDLDERGETATGWELATASHNTVVVDGLNQRETPVAARTPAAGSDFLFFAADPDFQVVMRGRPAGVSSVHHALPPHGRRHLERDEPATPCRSSRWKGACSTTRSYHAAPGRTDRWALAGPTSQPPASLLPPSITFLPSARPDQGRWFVQAYGEFRLEAQS